MDFDQLMGTTQRLNVSVEAIAAFGARLQASLLEAPVDPEVGDRLDAVIEGLGFDPTELVELPAPQRQALLGAIRAFFRQAGDLLDHPERPPGWRIDDVTVIEAQGRASGTVAGLVDGFADGLDGLRERLDRPGARFLDVGSGAGWLSIAMAQTFPGLDIVGVDLWPLAVERGRANVAATGLDDRIEIRELDIAWLDDLDAFDLAWLPGPFLPKAIIPAALQRVATALRPGGWVLLGRYAPADEPLAGLLTDLRVVRSGGHPWADDEAVEALARAGYQDVHPVERTWRAPLDFIAGRAP